MRRRRISSIAPCTAAGLLLVAAAGGCGVPHGPEREGEPRGETVEAEVVPRVPYLETYSCLELCHAELTPNPIERPLTEFHTLRVVRHGPAIDWCGFCHDLDNLDQLCLLGGDSVSFNEPHRICGQCHGERMAEWEAGIHGLQTGSWRQQPRRRTCTFCHDPHVPGVPRVEALPAPEEPPVRWRWP